MAPNRVRPVQRRNILLYAIVLIEGFCVLATELLAMRLLVPFAGSGVEVVSIVISAVLLPLAAGYHVGGMRIQKLRAKGEDASIRKLLLRNLLSALGILVFTLSYFLVHLFFDVIEHLGIRHTLVQTALFSACFLVYPVFLLAQTVPLITHYFARGEMSRVAGRLLFISTLGSFLGSVFATIVLMNTVGVNITAMITIGLLCLGVWMLAGLKRRFFDKLIATGLLVLMIFLNSPAMMARFDIVAQNAYNTVMIKVDGDTREMWLNHSRSARFTEVAVNRFPYIQYMEEVVLKGLPEGKSVLVIGSGGFGLGWENKANPFTFVDIDPDLKDLAEQHLLPEPLHHNKRFVAQSARAFLEHSDEQFDVIIIDVFTNQYSIPMETTTQEFWRSIDNHLQPDGVLAANIIMHASFKDLFSARIATTFDSVFPHHYRQTMTEPNLWDAEQDPLVNMLFIHKKTPHASDRGVYKDNLTTHSLDRFR
jgi:predicted membrane-bound spermidine synthase